MFSAPSSELLPWARLVRRRPPVEEAGRGLSKDKGTFWCADRRTGQTPQSACV